MNCTFECESISQWDTVRSIQSRSDAWKSSVACAVQFIDVSATVTNVKTSFITVTTAISAGAILAWAAVIIASPNTRSSI